MSSFQDPGPRTVPPTDSLFFALQPDEATARAIAELAARLRARHGLRGKVQAPELMHVTLHYMGRFHGIPEEILDRSRKALAAFRAAPFEVCFDRVRSFHRDANSPVVLAGGEALAPLHQFQAQLRTTLLAGQLPAPEKTPFTPHVTLLRDDREVLEEAIEPVCWKVHDFVLVRSLQGRGQHQVMARFPLQAGAA